MKTKSLLALFLSLIFVVQIARCDFINRFVGEREKEAEKLQQLIRNEVYTSLQLLSEEDDTELEPFGERKYGTGSELGSNELNRYYVTSQGVGKPTGKLEIPRESNSRYSYDDNSRNARKIDTSPNKPNPNSYLQRNYQYGLAPNAVSFDDNPKITRMNEFGSASSLNTREPVSTEIYTSYPTTYSTSFSLPFVGGNGVYSGQYGSGGSGGGRIGWGVGGSNGGRIGFGGGGSNGGRIGWGGSGSEGGRIGWGGGGMLGRALNRFGRIGGRFQGNGGGGSGYGIGSGLSGGLGLGEGIRRGLRLGSGLGSSLGLGGSGSGRYNLGINGESDSDYYTTYTTGTPSTQGGSINIGASGTPDNTYYQRYGSGTNTGSSGQYSIGTDTPIGQGGTLNIISGGRPISTPERYGTQTSYTLPTQGDGISYNTGSGRSRISYPSTSSIQNIPTNLDSDEVQYELMFLRDRQRPQPQSTTGDVQLQTTSGNGNGAVRVSTTGGGSGSGGLRTQTTSTSSDPANQKVQEYRVVLVNKDNAPGEAQSVASTSNSSGPSSSWSSVSTSSNNGGSGGQASSWGLSSVIPGTGTTSGSSRQGFQITTPITRTNLQVGLPSLGSSSVVSSANAAASTGEQTRSMTGGGEMSNGKIIKVISMNS